MIPERTFEHSNQLTIRLLTPWSGPGWRILKTLFVSFLSSPHDLPPSELPYTRSGAVILGTCGAGNTFFDLGRSWRKHTHLDAENARLV